MTIQTEKAEAVARLGIGLLERELVFGNLCWKDGLGNFVGNKNDTVNVVIPGFGVAAVRDIRGDDARQRMSLKERSIPVPLDKEVQFDIELTSANIALDITDFGAQVMKPAMKAVATGIEAEAIAGAEAADFAESHQFSYDPEEDDFWKDVVLKCRSALLKSRVPMDGQWYAALGTDVAEAALGTDMFAKVNESGDGGSAQSDAKITKKGGFTFFDIPGLAPNKAIFGHKSAFAFPQRAAEVSPDFPWGASESQDGMALRVVRGPDMATVTSVLACDGWMGFAPVTDIGTQDENDVFTPAEDPEDSGEEELFIRACLVTI